MGQGRLGMQYKVDKYKTVLQCTPDHFLIAREVTRQIDTGRDNVIVMEYDNLTDEVFIHVMPAHKPISREKVAVVMDVGKYVLYKAVFFLEKGTRIDLVKHWIGVTLGTFIETGRLSSTAASYLLDLAKTYVARGSETIVITYKRAENMHMHILEVVRAGSA